MAKASRNYTAEMRQRRQDAGLCIVCAQPSETRTCEACKAKDVQRQKEKQEARIARGLCKACGKLPFSEGHLYCEGCLEKANAATRKHTAKNKNEGRCWSCGVTCETGRCEQCRIKVNEGCARLREYRKANGLCRDCGKPAHLVDRTGQHHMPGGKRNASYCRDCFIRMTASYVLGSRKRWQELIRLLEESNWRCSYTGESLILGENLSFDHKNPVCRFPDQKHLIENIEPVSLTINLMKRHMTKEEFLRLVERIYLLKHSEATEEDGIFIS